MEIECEQNRDLFRLTHTARLNLGGLGSLKA